MSQKADRHSRIGRLLAACCALSWSACWAQSGVYTYHNDVSRTGQNTSERILTPAAVSSTRLQKLFTRSVDGDVYAQPLFVPGGRNVIVIATAADSVYTFDA